MIKSFRLPLFSFLFLFGSLALYRLLFVLNWHESTDHGLWFFFIGIAYDLLVSFEIALILNFLYFLLPNQIKLVSGVVSFVWLTAFFIDYGYYLEFRTHIPFYAGRYLLEWKEMQGSFMDYLTSLRFYALWLIPILTIQLFIWKTDFWSARLGGKTFGMISVVFFLLGATFGAVANSNVTDFVHPIQNNGLFYYAFRTSKHADPYRPVKLPKKGFERWMETRGLTKEFGAGEITPFYRKVRLASDDRLEELGVRGLSDWLRAKPRNLVIVIMESFNAGRIGAYNPKSDLSPQFDKLAEKGILFENFYANGKNTMRGQLALLFGLYPNPGLPVFRNYFRNQFFSLMAYFKHKGYPTSWVHAGSGSFDKQATMLLANHMDRLTTMLDFGPEQEKLSWGYSDHALMQKAVSLYKSEPEPFFSTILTLTNHHPFQLPKDYNSPLEQASPQQKAFYFSDQALGLLMEEASKHPFFENSLFVITSDTGSVVDDRSGMTERLTGHLADRIPLLFYWGAAKKGVRVQTFGHQVDLVPTLLDLMREEGPVTHVGESLFLDDQSREILFTHDLGVDRFLIVKDEKNGWEKARVQKSGKGLEKDIARTINHHYVEDLFRH